MRVGCNTTKLLFMNLNLRERFLAFSFRMRGQTKRQCSQLINGYETKGRE